ncbi:hypothetical protein FYJ43_03095 [Cutibacterium sp. WCA-380-WT-3A]|uniref:Uncharacterized protein n=1 Tax=Cutibacterium porci TaxID=2605781 RepID=A0A7K0J546_9ACTN|nr:hypothetical protein [Cutibacterium porci]MSS45054.1 hypothetical protein [Cutibacterium porci]
MLDVVLGHWWRAAIGGFQDHFLWLIVPLLAWMAVMIIGNRVVKDAEKAMRSELTRWSKARRAGPNLLADHLTPIIRQEAARHRWMPAANGLWLKRCDADSLVAYMTRMPHYFIHFRDDALGIRTRARKGIRVR